MKQFSKTILLSISLILLAACDSLQGIGLEPQIITFTATPDAIEAGENSTLAWNVIGGAEDLTITLSPGDTELDATGKYDVTPSETTVYILSASSEGKTVTEELTLSVSGSEPGEEPGENPEEPEENVLKGDVTVAIQADLDALAGVTRIEGSLSISTDADTLNFTPLDSLKTVTGNVALGANPNLIRIDGFASLTMIGTQEAIESTGALEIYSNPKLMDISGFEALETASALFISTNDSLKTFSAFGNLERSRIYIQENAVLEMLPEFSSLTDATPYFGGVVIVENPKLSSLNSFANLMQTSGLLIEDNDALISITGFAALDKVFTGANGNDEIALQIKNNSSLVEITGFENATNINGFGVSDNPKLKVISGFSSMVNGSNGRQGFVISDNPELEEITGFDALESAEPGLFLENLPNLTRTPSFENLKILSFGGLRITNTGLTSLDGFNSVTDAGEVSISENSALMSITGLNSLTNLFGLNISANPALTEISGFEALGEISGGSSSISDNSSFDCSTDPQASLAFFPIVSSSGNMANCPTIP